MGSTSHCQDQDHAACLVNWCGCDCHADLITEHFTSGHSAPVRGCQRCSLLTHLEEDVLAGHMLLDDSDKEDAILLIYTTIDAHHRAGDFAIVDAMFDHFPIVRTPVVLLLAFLSITKAAAHELPGRVDFAKQVRAHLEDIEPDRVERLLSGIE